MVDYQPTLAQATAASKYGGKVNQVALAALMTGKFEAIASTIVAEDIINKWAKSTQIVKEIAVRAFWNYLQAVGLEYVFFPMNGSVPDKTIMHSRAEERSLSNFSLLRCMSGQAISGILNYVSHIRTWYRTTYQCEFGKVGDKGKPSVTSQYIMSMSKHFPPTKKTTDDRREPIT